MFPLQTDALIPASCFPFRNVKKGSKYLGVEITATFSSIFTKNFSTLFENVRQIGPRWGTASLTWQKSLSFIGKRKTADRRNVFINDGGDDDLDGDNDGLDGNDDGLLQSL